MLTGGAGIEGEEEHVAIEGQALRVLLWSSPTFDPSAGGSFLIFNMIEVSHRLPHLGYRTDYLTPPPPPP